MTLPPDHGPVAGTTRMPPWRVDAAGRNGGLGGRHGIGGRGGEDNP